jgi:hypothetical protein
MSQNDLVIANQTFPSFRSDLNNALQALGSLNSGSSSPPTTYANMIWYDTSANLLKVRSEADDAWISIGYLDQSSNSFKILDDTLVVNTSGTQTGLIGDQATSTWNSGTGTVESLISPAKLTSSISTYISNNATGVGIGQTWQNVGGSRSDNTAYRNTTSTPIQVALTASTQGQVQLSTNGSSWVVIQHAMGIFGQSRNTITFIVPVNHYYKITSTFEHWAELR